MQTKIQSKIKKATTEYSLLIEPSLCPELQLLPPNTPEPKIASVKSDGHEPYFFIYSRNQLVGWGEGHTLVTAGQIGLKPAVFLVNLPCPGVSKTEGKKMLDQYEPWWNCRLQ